jgi:L,D-peptidoglycan transpeptidase YkuD (ErfK/YbiS/YcfS/YnhG family)
LPPAATSPPDALISQIPDTSGAAKVITVVSPQWSSKTADLTLWQRTPDGWVTAGGPWEAHVGYGGWAWEPGEGAGLTPIGSFTFGTGFGTGGDPGYSLGWFDITSEDYWVEDPASPDYNRHLAGPANPRKAPWSHFEHLIDYPVAYRYAALINFNVPAVSGRGSGIFLHVSTGGPTAGCVSLPTNELLTTLRWIDGGTRIYMGPDDTIRSL